MVQKKVFLIAIVLVSLVFALNFVSALGQIVNVSTSSNGMITQGSNNLVNITINATDFNITKIVVNITGGLVYDHDSFIIGSNGTSGINSSFVNTSYQTGVGPFEGYTTTLTWNTSGPGMVTNSTLRYFWFNITARKNINQGVQLTVTAYNATLGEVNATILPLIAGAFGLVGFVKNETGGYQNGTNVSIWRFQEGQNGPPTETLVTSALTDVNGRFSLSGINASPTLQYKIKMIYYNESDSTQALKIGVSLPAFPPTMFYSMATLEEVGFEFMRPPSLNGTTFYLGPAATLNLTATNGTVAQRFGYMVMEEGTGNIIESNMMTNVSNAQIVIPINRNYTVMFIRANSFFADSAACTGYFMNNTLCKTPPKANSSINPTTSGQVININQSLVITRVRLSGCIGVSGNTTPITVISAIMPKMTPWAGFIPPMRPDTQDMNITNNPAQLNYSDPRCPGKIAFYNISLLSNPYFVEFYGRNATSGSGGEYLGAFQNVTMAADNSVNVTLVQLAGSFSAASAFDTSDTNRTKFTFRVQNSSGGAITNDKPRVQVRVTNSVFGTLTFMMDDITNGSFNLALPLNSTAKIKVFSSNSPPKEKVVNLSAGSLNITLSSMTNGKDSGFRRINSSGQMEMMNITEGNFGVNMTFIRAGGSCDVLSPDASCTLTSTGVTVFNPFSAMVAGKVNMKMKMASSNVSIVFYNFDMFAAKQPPMESIMDNQAFSGSDSANQVWQFGSFVPADVYDYAIVGMPYSDSIINESANINISIPVLYDENWNASWNATRGDTQNNLTTSIDDYVGTSSGRSFNSSGYRDLLGTTGVACSKTNSNVIGISPEVYCYVDTTNNLIYMRIPHFSGVSPTITGSAPTAAATVTSDTDSSSGSASNAPSEWLNTWRDDNEDLDIKGEVVRSLGSKERIRIKINNETHYVGVINLTSTTAIINVSSTPQQATFSIGESKKFELGTDGYYDLFVTLKSISGSKANVSVSYIHELIPVQSQANIENASAGLNVEKIVDEKVFVWRLWMTITLIVIVVIIVAVVLFVLYKRNNPEALYKHKVKVKRFGDN